jgi:hypothetical protein
LTLFTAIGATTIFVLSFVLICAATVATFRCLGGMITRCAHHTRVAYAAGALASFACIFAVGAAGIWGASAVLGW